LRPAAVDHFLRAPLDLGVAALHGIEVERLLVRPRIHARRRASAETDAHARPAELDEQRPRRDLLLARLRGRDVAHPAGDHDGLVIAAPLTRDALLEGTEVAREIG